MHKKMLQVTGEMFQVWRKLGGFSVQLAACSLLLLLNGCIFFSVNLANPAGPLEEQKVAGSGKDKILLISISGVISEEEKTSGLSTMPGLVTRVREELEKAASDRRVKAVVLRIDSPGGGVTPSDIIYHEIRAFQETDGEKVIAHIRILEPPGATTSRFRPTESSPSRPP
jgi:protease-4